MDNVENVHDRRWVDGEQHSLRNLGDTEMQLLTVYDPPRVRD